MNTISIEQERINGFAILLIQKSGNRVQTMFKELGYEIKL